MILCNTESETYNEVPLFVLLDVYGAYFFAPSYSDFDYYTITLEPGAAEKQILPEFAWPANVGSASDIVWLAAMTNAEISELFGAMDTWSFSWGD